MAKAHRPLWIDSKGQLCDQPPSTGFKIAAAAGVAIPRSVMEEFNLTSRNGKIYQGGRLPKSPESTPPKVVADREIFADEDGGIFDTPQATGIKVCDAGRPIPVEYLRRYNLERDKKGDIIVQNSHPHLLKKKDAQNKARRGIANKSAGDQAPAPGERGSGGLSVTTPEGVTHDSGGAS